MGKHFCNEICKFNDNQDKVCEVSLAYHVGRTCVTFRKRSHQENYRDLMRPSAGICHRKKGSMQNGSRELLK